ncbi:Uncharacterised protein [Achromobacter xylosoxidans]|nr:Uncharacterised protein [Achromobacter xylosoxidans]
MHPGFLQAEHLWHCLTDSSASRPTFPPNAKEGRPRGRFWRPRQIFRPAPVCRQNTKHTIRPRAGEVITL